jgi:hypothetical protein
MRSIFLILLFFVSLTADVKFDMLKLFQEKEYDKACKKGLTAFRKYRNDEEFISLYAHSCLQADYIDRLAVPISALKKTEDARANAAYFSVILMQKKLLLHALLDGYDLTSVRLPTTDYVLSKVFDLYAKDPYPKTGKYFAYTDPEKPLLNYKLYTEKKGNISKMIIEEYYDTMLLKRHIYW